MSIFSVERIVSVDSLYSLVPRIASSGTFGDAVWPSANAAVYIGFEIWATFRADRIMVVNGATVSGNLDVGIYDASGNRIISTGSTAQSGADQPQILSITPTDLDPGFYYFAFAKDNTTGSHFRYLADLGFLGLVAGVYQEASAFPLPATEVFANHGTYIPWIGILREGA